MVGIDNDEQKPWMRDKKKICNHCLHRGMSLAFCIMTFGRTELQLTSTIAE